MRLVRFSRKSRAERSALALQNVYSVDCDSNRPLLVIECPAAVNDNFLGNEKLDRFHFGPLFNGDDAGLMREHSRFT